MTDTNRQYYIWAAVAVAMLICIGGIAFGLGQTANLFAPTPEPSPTPTPELPRELPETHLIVASGEGLVGRRWRFTGRILRIGAAADNDVVVELPQVSGQHAQFELFVSGDVYVSDLGSTNGTWHQGDRLPSGGRVQVRPGDRVALSRQLVLELVQPGREDQA